MAESNELFADHMQSALTDLHIAPSPFDHRALPFQPYVGVFQVYADRARRHRSEIPILILAIIVSSLSYLSCVIYFASEISDSTSSKHAVNTSSVQTASVILLLPALIAFARGLLWGKLKVNAIEICPTQFPEAYQWLVEISAIFGLKRIPKAYVQLGNGTINAFSSGHGFRRFVVIYSDLFEVSGKARDPEAVKFILGHEVGHIAAGHTSWWRQIFSSFWMQIPIFGSLLSRAQEYTADNYGYAYCPEGAAKTMSILTGGKYLYRHTDPLQLVGRAEQKNPHLWLAC